MQIVPNGPYLELGLIQALEEGKLAFFCGAGISVPDLPTFKDLTIKVQSDLEKRAASGLVKKEIDKENFDRALLILKKNYGATNFEKTVVHFLTIKRPSLATHKALLTLSKTRDGRFRCLFAPKIAPGFALKTAPP